MKNYDKQLEEFGSDTLTKNYLDKYWIDQDEAKEWIKMKESFKKLECETITEIGGVVFYKDEFEQMKKFMNICGDTFFVLLEINNSDNRIINFKFPLIIEWDELLNGGWLSYECFERPIRCYFIIGNSGKWCRFIDNDLETPVQITKLKLNMVNIFKEIMFQKK